MVRSKGDKIIDHALDSRIERESMWKKKHLTVTEMQRMWQNNIVQNNIGHEDEACEVTGRKLNQAKKAML